MNDYICVPPPPRSLDHQSQTPKSCSMTPPQTNSFSVASSRNLVPSLPARPTCGSIEQRRRRVRHGAAATFQSGGVWGGVSRAAASPSDALFSTAGRPRRAHTPGRRGSVQSVAGTSGKGGHASLMGGPRLYGGSWRPPWEPEHPLGAPVPGRRTPPLCPPHQQLNLNTCRRLFQSSVPLWDFLIFTPNFRGRLLTTADSEWAGPLEPDRHHYGMLGPLLRWLDRPLDAPPPDPRTFHSHHTS